eukprot:6137891-Amphidinium_carterae.1
MSEPKKHTSQRKQNKEIPQSPETQSHQALRQFTAMFKKRESATLDNMSALCAMNLHSLPQT